MLPRTVVRQIPQALIGGLAILLVGYVTHGVFTYRAYTTAFAQTKQGEPLETVLARFGPPSHIEPRYDSSGYAEGNRSVCSGPCWLRLWYELPFTLGVSPVSVDFDARQRVIHKYEWNSP